MYINLVKIKLPSAPESISIFVYLLCNLTLYLNLRERVQRARRALILLKMPRESERGYPSDNHKGRSLRAHSIPFEYFRCLYSRIYTCTYYIQRSPRLFISRYDFSRESALNRARILQRSA